jgi:hypothetical protein
MRTNVSSLAAFAAAVTLALLGCSQGSGQVRVGASSITSDPGSHPAMPPPSADHTALMVTIDEIAVHVLAGDPDDHRPAGSPAQPGDRDDRDDRDGGADHGKGPHQDADVDDHGGGHGEGHGDDDGHDGEPDRDAGWFTVFHGAQALDLLDPQADKGFLGTVSVPAGRVTALRLVLAPTITLLLDGNSTPVTCPSCSAAGLLVVIPGGATVSAGGTLDLSFAVDVQASLVLDQSGWRLEPVVRIVGAKNH